MKRWTMLLLALLLVVGLFGCHLNSAQQVTEPPAESRDATESQTEAVTEAPTEVTEPAVTELLFGLGIANLEPEAAYDVLAAKARMYTLELTVNGKPITLSAEDLELSVSQEALTACLAALKEGKEADPSGILTYNEANIRRAISAQFDRAAQNARIVYNGSAFVLEREEAGVAIGSAPAVKAAKEAIAQLSPTAQAEGEIREVSPTLFMDSPQAKDALAKANSYLSISLTYTFSPESGSTRSERLSQSTIASFITFDRDLNPQVSRSKIESHASALNDKYHVPGEPGKFQATGGYTINIEVTYAGELVDVNALRDDIYYCVSNHISGTRAAKYLPKEEAGDLSFGGNYIEVNMSSQHLWVYKNGQCVVSTPVVTGCVYYGWYTPTGVYTINNKATGVYLQGNTYVTYVDYWMAFIGYSYGFHDASWRDEFGGDIYLRDGSHGCVNLPPKAAAQVYNNISVGTKVVIYGGATKADPVDQIIEGTNAYSLAADGQPFKLDAKLVYPVAELSYASSDPAVVEVAADGTVTPKGVGTATITVSAPAAEYYTAGELKVTVTVISPCDEGRHVFGSYTQTKAPTCTAAGVETSKCDNCDVTQERAIPATGQHTQTSSQTTATCTQAAVKTTTCSVCGTVLKTETVSPALGHKFTPEEEHCLNGCGTANPDYVAPTEPPVTEPDPTEPEPTEPDPTKPEPTEPEPTEPDPTEPAQGGGDGETGGDSETGGDAGTNDGGDPLPDTP